MADHAKLSAAIAAVPARPWAVGVSGGADSVALLRLLHQRPGFSLHVIHLDHETRGADSAVDADFVRDLSRQLNLPCTIARRSDVQQRISALPKNRSAQFRAARFQLFREVVQAESLNGVILAHHANDQAETILMRLLRGGGVPALVGMLPQRTINGLCVLRPLLNIDPAALRAYLNHLAQPWREDASNRSPQYLRNRLRPLLEHNPALQDALSALSVACKQLDDWHLQYCPVLPPAFPLQVLADAWPPLARRAAQRWLLDRGAKPTSITDKNCEQLRQMATDAAIPPHGVFPGNLHVHRRRGVISVTS